MLDPTWLPFAHLFKRQELPAKTILLQEGEVARRVYFIEAGCLRIWFNDNGKDITFQFFFEGDGVSSIESFRSHQPSLFTLETIEPCTLLVIEQADFETMLAASSAIRAQVEEQVFQRLLYYQRLFLSRIKNNPAQRYAELVASHPQILQRVPQHFIASFLGITPVSLSRIRNRR
jgi:CRP-like cAMP-binding protein